VTLRTRAIALSLLPLVITFLLALPEAMLQLRVSADSVQARHAQLAAGAARNIEDSRALLSIYIRRWATGDPLSPALYAKTVREMQDAMDSLDALAGPDAVTIELGRRLNANAAKVRADFNEISRMLRVGNLAAAAAQKTSPGYFDDAESLQASVKAFVSNGRAIQEAEFASFQRLGYISLVLLLIALVGLVVSSGFLWFNFARAADRILDLVRKAQRYRNGEQLGTPSRRHDEIGLLDGAIHEFVAVQRQRERELKRYRLLAEVTHDIILFVDRVDLTIIDANAAALVAYGYADLTGKPTSMLHAAEDPSDSAMMALSDRPEGLSYEGLHQRSDGTVFPVEVHARTAEVEGRLTIVKTIRDISERRRAAEQVSIALDHAIEASRMKSEFVATMSHEIRTPMHGVIGMSELLLETQLQPVQREYAATVKESAQALLSIIDDILDFSKLEANKIELEAVAFDPAQLVASAINLARGAARDKGITLRSQASAHVPSAVRGDPTRVRQVLINLIGNAVKFTPSGEISVSTSVDSDDGKSVVLLFAVSDTGIGVNPEARERLFDAFVQGDGSMTRRFGGTGLGLSISHRLVELMNGRIWLGKHEGPGSTFLFTARFGHTGELVIPPKHAPGSLRVLVLDDNALARSGFEAKLSAWGMHAVAAGDIESARKLLLDAAQCGTPFDVVMIDYILPHGDGITFAAELAQQDEYGHPRCILVTAFDAVGRKAAAHAAGCAAYLPKPVDPSDLFDALGEIDRSRKARIPASGNGQRRARILMAEDSALIRRVASFQLEELEYAVDIVENGAQAVDAVAQGNYELVLMDMRMPEMDGLAATRAIREAERESGGHIVIVALTANVLDDDRQACVAAGMDDFLAKPLKLEVLRVVLERWLRAPTPSG
jgi:two-component system, sensor histidine kinase and response regulator